MIYNGRDFSEFGVHVDESKAFGSPEKDYEMIEVVGRNGNLSIYNDRFKDIVLSFPCFIRSGFIEKYRNLLAYLNSLNGYQRLETEKEPNHFRKALFTGSVEVQTTPWNQGGFFTINYSALPQRFLKSGETTTSVSSSSSSVSGNPVSISNPSGLTALTGLNVDIEPVQDLNGYDHPWVGGAGKNLLDTFGRTFSASSETVNTIRTEGATATFQGDSIVTVTNGPWSKLRYRVEGLTKGQTYTLSAYIKNPSKNFVGVSVFNGTSWVKQNVAKFDETTVSTTFTYDDSFSVLVVAVVTNNSGSATNVTVTVSSVQLELGATATAYAPYENICPITGHTSATVTRTVDGSTTDYTIELNGTVYGGELDVLTGVLTVTDENIASYNGETLPSTWISDRDVYASGTTPTTGAQVVYKLASPQTVQLTPQQVSLLTGTNIISTDMNSLTVTIASPAELENPTLFESKPIIRVYGNGTLNVNDIYITVANSPYTYIDIDCELMDCYHGSNNANQYVSFSTTDYVTLRSGTNYFNYSGFSKVEVTPRWFEV